MTASRFMIVAACLASAVFAAHADAAEPSARLRPNILFLFADDQRFDAAGALGTPALKTPNMDRLAEQGVVFTHAHIMGSMSGAVCMPSRAMLMSGRGLFHLEADGRQIPPAHPTLPETLHRAGYVTFGTGKWHNGHAAYARSFDDGGSIMFGGMSDHLKVPAFDFSRDGTYPKKNRSIGEKFSSELFSDEAIRFLDSLKGDAPFFCYVSYTAPHDPRMAPEPYASMYDSQQIPLPPNFMAEHPFDNGELKIRDEMLAPFPRTPEIVREHIAAYYAMISHLDTHIGRVLEALERSGRADDTIIIYAADNGLAVGRHGLLGKQNLYDHSARVPLIISLPDGPRGRRVDGLCYLHDIYPAVCDLAGVKIPPSVEAVSLAPAITDPAAKLRDEVYLAYKNNQRGLRRGDWKLIEYRVDGKRTTQLFNLRTDPHELGNLAEEPRFAGRVREMRRRLADRMREIDDPCRLDAEDWGCPAVP